VIKTMRSFAGVGSAVLLALAFGSVHPAAQQAPAGAALQLPPSGQRPPGNLPLRDVQTSWNSISKRISPQDGFAMMVKPTGMTPRDEDGHPDLSGNWGAGFPNPIGQAGLRRRGGFEPDQAAMQRGAQWNKPLYKPEYWDKVRSLDFGKSDIDPAYGCHTPVGVPRQNVPGRIVQKNKQIWLLNGVENMLRILPLDGRKRDEQDHEYSFFNGQGVARWDGDTLVIESVGFNDISWLGWEGYFHTDRMEVTERFLRQGDLLYYNFTVNDPEVLLEPWTSMSYVRRINPNPARQEEAAQCDERDLNLLADPFLRG
jgi:hypothetical protein